MFIELGQIPTGRNKKYTIQIDMAQFSNLLLAPLTDRENVLKWLNQIIIPSLIQQQFGKIKIEISLAKKI